MAEDSNINPANEKPVSPLILGGHSFISQLGNDPPASPDEQRAIVASCLDNGIRWFDTTYQPERVALGKALDTLGRRREATIMAWNFFTDFTPREPVGKPEYYRAEHIEVVLEQLRTSYVDCLVVVPLDDPEENHRQVELAIEWQKKGYARSLGLRVRELTDVERHRKENPFSFATRPFNVTTADESPAILAACKACRWETFAMSPFGRGSWLDKIVAIALAHGDGDADTLRRELADLMLRFSLFQPNVDRVIVAMRKILWVSRNLESVARGPLTMRERRRLLRLRRLVTEKQSWWNRLFSKN